MIWVEFVACKLRLHKTTYRELFRFVSIEPVACFCVLVMMLLHNYDVFYKDIFSFIRFFTYMTKTYYDVCSYVKFYLQTCIYAENVIVGFPHGLE